MKSKQFCLFFILVLASISSLISCKKDTVSTYPISGVYTGTYTVNDVPAQGALPYNFSILPDGTITTKGSAKDGSYAYASGTWTLAGNAFTANITTLGGSGQPISQSITATFSNAGTLTNGVWVDTNNPYHAPYSGKFSTMQRVN